MSSGWTIRRITDYPLPVLTLKRAEPLWSSSTRRKTLHPDAALHPDGVAWGAVGESVVENDTVANLARLMEATVETGTPMVISPHYYYPTDHGWKFEGTLEKLMHAIQMFDRKGPLDVEDFEGSGADWMEEFKPYLNDGKTIICSPHKVYGPQNNDVVLQLQKQRVEKVVAGGHVGQPVC